MLQQYTVDSKSPKSIIPDYLENFMEKEMKENKISILIKICMAKSGWFY
ncbi:hypothetical protein YN1HA_12520 [Sulfurisphaera ohwakuensis]